MLFSMIKKPSFIIYLYSGLILVLQSYYSEGYSVHIRSIIYR